MNKPTLHICKVLIVSLQCFFLNYAVAFDQPQNLPAGHRLIGSYELNSKLRVENGVSQPVVISPLIYRVYSDGIELRVYCKTAGEDNYTVYDIYRSDGVGVVKKAGDIEIVAGVQAYSTRGDVLRQISVTRNSLTMIQSPPRSHRVIITRAIAQTSSVSNAVEE